jgi:hypothetical protein
MAASREYFRQNRERGFTLEQVAAECGLTQWIESANTRRNERRVKIQTAREQN